MKKIGIIGTGMAGLSVAARLASKGHSVTCFEASSTCSGKLTVLKKNGSGFKVGLFSLSSAKVISELV